MTRARPDLSQLSAIARQAAQARDWATVGNCAKRILEQDKNSPEGFFLSGLALKSQGQVNQAVSQFSRALSIDAGRYDAAVELANQYANLLRHREALDLLQRYAPRLSNSPLYLDMAANTYSRLGLHAQAWPLYQQANALQPGIDSSRPTWPPARSTWVTSRKRRPCTRASCGGIPVTREIISSYPDWRKQKTLRMSNK